MNWSATLFRAIFVSLICAKLLLAVGESAVITLEFPGGAENTGMGESGVSLDNSIFCAFYNPASVACFAKKNDIQFAYGRFFEPILPAFGIPDLWHGDTTFGVFLPNIFPFVDIGYVHFRKYLNFGVNTWTDEYGRALGTARSYEVVEANTVSLLVYDMLSFGVTFKEFDSQLAPGFGPSGEGTAQGNNYDIGLRLHKKFTVFEAINIEPAFGIAWHTLGDEKVWYISPAEADPLPRKLLYGLSTTIDLFGLFGYTGVFEIDRQDFDVSFTRTDTVTGVTSDTSYEARDRIVHEGHCFSIGPFYRKYYGHLVDYTGKRLEKTSGTTKTFNYRQLLNSTVFIVNLFNKDLASRIRKFDESLFNGWFRPNIYVALSESKIEAIDSDARQGQEREDLSWGFSVVGIPQTVYSSIREHIRKDSGSKEARESEDAVLQEENGDLVE